MNGILQTEAYVLGGRIYPPRAILTKKEFKDPERLVMLEKNLRNKGNGVYFGRDFRRNCDDPQMKTITDMNLSHLVLSDDVEYKRQQRNYQIAMSDEKGRLSYSTKLRNPDGSGLLQYSDGFVACSPIPMATHAKMIGRILGTDKGTMTETEMEKGTSITPARTKFSSSWSYEDQIEFLVNECGYTPSEVRAAKDNKARKALYKHHVERTTPTPKKASRKRTQSKDKNMGFGIRG